MKQRHKIQFPRTNVHELEQDEVFFYLVEEKEKRRVRLHDYDVLYQKPGLYEQVVYERLKCQSPKKVSELLKYTVGQSKERVTELRVLDLGVGNGMMGEELKKVGVSRLVGVDIIPEAEQATNRD